MGNKKDLLDISREDIIRTVAVDIGQPVKTVQAVFDSIEDTVIGLLKRATNDRDIRIRLLRGLVLKSSYQPERKMTSNLTGDKVTVHEGIKPKATFTQWYRDLLSSHKE